MATYLELKAQAEQLLAQAEQMKAKETQDVIADIKSKIANYGLTAEDLGLSGRGNSTGRPRQARKTQKSTSPVKYRGPNGETWGGGRGRKPQWVVDALAKGKNIEDFRA
jgi:DNA-binding protein H-NS